MAIIYFKGIEDIISIYEKTIEISGGGAKGILDLGLLEAALEHIKNDDYYPNFCDKLTHLFFVANKHHCFQDGNKRIAISICATFLLYNGYLSAARRFLFKMEAISYHVASGRIDKEFLHDIVEEIIQNEDFSETIKLRLIDVLGRE